jgi:arylsulfatase A-like enzyme/Tfp pilus assembly protein PilF
MKFYFKHVFFSWLVISYAPLTFAASPSPQHRARPNVLLITVDTVRADHVGCYGYKSIQTPTIDALAEDGILYEHAIAQVPLTWPSHTAIMTGTYPFQNGVQDFTGQPLDPKFQTLAQALKRNGYATGAVVSSFVLDRTWGLARGFDFYDDAFSAKQFETRDLGLVERRATESVDHALKWLKHASAAKPFFFWLHLYDPHSPYDPPPPFAEQYKTYPYDGEIAYADAQLGRLISWLKASGRYQKTLIIFVSDHGESLGAHGEREHGFFLYDATTRVPLIVKLPGPAPRGVRMGAAAETLDIGPTILHELGIRDNISKQFQGTPLPLRSNQDDSERAAYSETFYPFSSFGWSPLHSLQSERYEYIEAPKPELYDLQTDPAEENNVAGSQTAVAAVMKQALASRMAKKSVETSSAGSSAQLSPDAIEKLRALGYMAFKSPVSVAALNSGLSDPKDKIWEFNSILEAADDFQAAKFQDGVSLLQQVQEKDPEMYLVPFMLGEAQTRQEQWSQAKVNLERSLKLNPTFDQAMTALARADHGLGQDDEARKWLNQAIKANPQNYRAWYELGWIEAGSDPQSAQSAFAKSVEIQPNFGPGHRELGMLEYQQKQYREGAANLEKAVQLGAKDAKVLNNLGICYGQTGRTGKALISFQQAVQLDPQLAPAHLNLGFAYQKSGRTAEAQREYDSACKLDSRLCRLTGR